MHRSVNGVQVLLGLIASSLRGRDVNMIIEG